jgi:hypothetical protein
MGEKIRFVAGEGGGAFTPYPEGTYDLQIQGVVQGASKAGNAQLKLSCEIATPDTQQGSKVTIWYSLLPQSGWKLRMLLDATGVPYDITGETDESGNEVLEFDPEELELRYFRVECSTRKHDGKVYNDWKNEEASPLGQEATPAEAPKTVAKAPMKPGNGQAQVAQAAAPGSVAPSRRPRLASR